MFIKGFVPEQSVESAADCVQVGPDSGVDGHLTSRAVTEAQGREQPVTWVSHIQDRSEVRVRLVGVLLTQDLSQLHPKTAKQNKNDFNNLENKTVLVSSHF